MGRRGVEGNDTLSDEDDECHDADDDAADNQRASGDSRPRLHHESRVGRGEATSGSRSQ